MKTRAAFEVQSTNSALHIQNVAINQRELFFKHIKYLPQKSQINAAIRREESTQAKTLADATATIDKATKVVAALEKKAILVLTGESRLDLAIINQLIPKQQAALDAALEGSGFFIALVDTVML